MKQKLPFIMLASICLISFQVMSQRYVTEVFSSVSVAKDVVYGENYSILSGSPVLEDLKMDVYTPDGDTATSRYLIIMMHAGSFLPKGVNTLPFGNKEDSTMIEMCTQFAKRGWTAASIDYRLGWDPTPDVLGGNQETRASTIINAVYRSMQDAKTCIRFFRMDAATNGNTYGIDPARVAIGGSNSGGYAALAVTSLDKITEIQYPKFLDGNAESFINTAVTGGFDGEGGMTGVNMVNHVGYASNAQLTLNLGGALGDSAWVEAGEAPIVSFHGEADALTPYRTGVVIVAATGDQILEVSGSFVVGQEADADGINSVFNSVTGDTYTTVAESRTSFDGLFPFPGLANGFEPWAWYDSSDPNIDNTTPGASGSGSAANPFANKAKALLYIDTIMNYFNPRAVEAMQNPIPLGKPLGISQNEEIASSISVYPVPSKDQVTVATSLSQLDFIEITDIRGQLVNRIDNINRSRFIIERDNLPSGVYLIRVNDRNNNSITKRLIFE